jgi:hypothetical protein
LAARLARRAILRRASMMVPPIDVCRLVARLPDILMPVNRWLEDWP